MSDERDGAGSAGTSGPEDTGSGAVVTRPNRPSGKRSRRAPVGEDAGSAIDLDTGTEASPTKNGSGSAKKTAKKRGDGPSRNPFLFVWNFLKQVVAELRKVIWPNRKQMVSYTIVVLAFLAFMVALIGGVDYGLAKLVMLVFG
ncbi:protein translocase subunit secE/sec61 gamma [Mycolicibacterium rutilum]|uniref:Protein translocase subunit SecE n=1 Tax=Mycolicibacterium rutilum TaxID=370526 RepID=A0A1H6ICH9_MYCRU|nr:preprotein translocase subunit SecE [Mycolicibacterium rutilum]SEH46521.1 protein translocase subunit secE/sec61 gamma [Mycolicibacterium rutilum]